MSTFIERAQNGWETATREEIKTDAEVLGIELKGNFSDETARARLQAAVGTIAQEAKPVTTPRLVAARPTEMPNLTTMGKWGGRCRDVSVSRPVGDASYGVPVRWEDMLIYIPFAQGKESKRYTIPEPHFFVLQNATRYSFILDPSITKNGIDRSGITEEFEQAYPYQDYGITPGTEHLPGSILEWYQWEAERKNYFEAFRFSRLEEIWSQLKNAAPVDPRTGNEWNREKLRKEILRFLGKDYLKHLVEDEEDPTLKKMSA